MSKTNLMVQCYDLKKIGYTRRMSFCSIPGELHPTGRSVGLFKEKLVR